MKKLVEGEDGGEGFMFQISPAPSIVPSGVTSDGIFILYGGQQMTFTGLPYGMEYTIKEVEKGDNYTAEVTEEAVLIEAPSHTVEFTNVRKTGELKVEKSVSGLDSGESFPFKISPIPDELPLGVAEDGTFSLRGGDSITFKKLPYGKTFDVTELYTGNLYTVTTTNQSQIISEETPVLTFENTRKEGSIIVKKQVSGADTEEMFKFKISPLPKFIPEGVLDDGTFYLKGGDSLTFYGLPYGETYTVQELYSGSIFTVESGEMTRQIISDSYTMNFVNTRKVGEVTVRKTVIGEDDRTEFEFQISPVPSTLPSGVDENGMFTLRGGDAITFTNLPYGEQYEITELYGGTRYEVTEQVKTILIDAISKDIEFINTRKTGELIVKKIVLGADGGETFEFQISPIPDELPEGVTEDGRFYLKSEEEITFTGLPYGINYTITELLTGDTYKALTLSLQKTIDEPEHRMYFFNGRNRGNLKIVKTFEGTRKYKQGIQFRIESIGFVSPEYDFVYTTNEDGIIEVNGLYVGEYKITELESGETMGYILAEPDTATIEFGKTATVTFDNQLQKGSLEIIKTFEDKTYYVSDVPFRIFGTSDAGEIYDEIHYTGENGKIEIKDLPVGTYTVRELDDEANAGYQLSEDKTVTVEYNNVAHLEINNLLMRGNLEVIKTFEGKDFPIEGVQFRLHGISNSGIEIDRTLTTDKDGKILEEELPIGTYTLTELAGNKNVGYFLTEPFEVSIRLDLTTTVNIENELLKGNLRVIKTFEGTTVPVKGVEFRLFGTSTAGIKIDETLLTDESGKIECDGLPVGTYALEETANAMTVGYITSDHVTTEIIVDKTAEIEIENQLQRGSLEIIKTFEDKTYYISNVPFRIFGTSTAGQVYDKVQYTDENGKIEIKDLPVGTYTVRELDDEANAGYHLSEDKTVTVEYNNVAHLEINNLLMRGNLEVIKTFEGKDFPIEGVQFRLHGISDSGIEIDRTLTTDKDGKILEEELPIGTYTLTELANNKNVGYFLTEPFEVSIRLDLTTEVNIENELLKGNLRVIKTFEGVTVPVKGVAFRLFGTSTAGINIDETLLTDEGGKIERDGLPIGTYTLEEIANAMTVGYITSEHVTTEIIVDKTAEIEIENQLQRGSLEIIKTFEDKTYYVSDVPFRIYGTSTAGQVYDVIRYTDESGRITIDGLPVGTYTVQELEGDANAGYILSEEKTVEVEYNKVAHLQVYNQIMRGTLEVIKTFEGKTVPIEGVKFRLQGTSDSGFEIDIVLETDADGKIVKDNLPVGEYKLTELESELTIT